jgi:hypothetical protein
VIGFYAAGAMGSGGGGGGALYDLVMSDLSSFGGFYLRLGESSGTTAANEAGSPSGTFSGAPSTITLGNPALYPGGPTAMAVVTNHGRVSFPGTSVPALNSMTLGMVVKLPAVTGVRPIITRDDNGFGATRFFQFRVNGSNLEFIKIVGGVEVVARAHGMSAGDAALLMVTIATGGTTKMFKNGAKLGADAAHSGANYGGSNATEIQGGNFYNSNFGVPGDQFSEMFVLAGELSEARVAAYGTAVGL